MLKKSFILGLTLAGAMSLALTGWAADKDIVILYTNDVHCGVDDNLGYARLAALKDNALQATPHVALVDAGDAIQGAPIGKLTNGEAIVRIMNKVGYDFAIPGNHEFDYGMDVFFKLNPMLEGGYYSANFMDLRTKKPVLPASKIMDFDGTKVAFVGATTPGALVSSNPIYFQDGKGKYIYGFCEDLSGKKLYKQLQKEVNKVRKAGADYVFLVGHLGNDGSEAIWSSNTIAAKTTGIDGIIDGHDHQKNPATYITNKKGKQVLVTETGTKLKTVGKLVITPEGKITSELVATEVVPDAKVAALVAQERAAIAPILNQPIGDTKVVLTSSDPKTGRRLVRNGETNLSNFIADAFKYVLDADVAMINGGAIRKTIPAGVFTFNQVLETFPFGNMTAVKRVKGQVILDALEMGSRYYPTENGGFMQVAGMTYTIDTAVPSSVTVNDKGHFTGVAGAYRVKDVKIGGVPLDVNKEYTVAGSAYVLKAGGDGMTMFSGAGTLVQDENYVDSDVLIEYVQNHLNAVIEKGYENPYGQGRITIK